MMIDTKNNVTRPSPRRWRTVLTTGCIRSTPVLVQSFQEAILANPAARRQRKRVKEGSFRRTFSPRPATAGRGWCEAPGEGWLSLRRPLIRPCGAPSPRQDGEKGELGGALHERAQFGPHRLTRRTTSAR